jgi:hypothetical protein
VLTLIILGVGAAMLLTRDNDTASDPVNPPVTGAPPGGSAPPGGTSAPPQVVNSKADEAVKSYLEALAAGQAGLALALGKDQPTDTTFLTDAVLADSLKRAPITAISVSSPDDEYDNSVEASYKLGDQQVNETFTVQKTGDNYLLYDIAQNFSVESIRSRTLPLLINGVAVQSDEVYLFPGSYLLTSGNEYASYGNGALVVKHPGDYPNAYELRPKLTLNYQDPAIAEVGISIDWSATAKGREDGQSATFAADGYDYVTVKAKITEGPLKPVFTR